VTRPPEVFADCGLTDDAFLGGRLRLWQPATGYRAAMDPVLLAAAVPARAGEAVLDLGCGAGAAALCLAARVPGLALAGLELQGDYAALARANAARNDLALQVTEGDVAAMPVGLRARVFDHVLTNPPYYGASGPAATDAGRDLALREALPLGDWIAAGLRRLRPGGRITVIQSADRLADLLAALAPGAGSVAVLPVAPRDGRPARRVIVSARKGGRGALRLLAPLVLHAAPAHAGDGEDFTDAARAVLRDAAALPL
jgi:tRNA1(Val) A37 N6-methylase TrmN6